MLRHMTANTDLIEKLDQVIEVNVYVQGGNRHSCLICKKVIPNGLTPVRLHFIQKHMQDWKI